MMKCWIFADLDCLFYALLISVMTLNDLQYAVDFRIPMQISKVISLGLSIRTKLLSISKSGYSTIFGTEIGLQRGDKF